MKLSKEELEKRFAYHKEELEKRFTCHKPKKKQIHKHRTLRILSAELAEYINEECPDSRAKSIAITKLEEVIMWANASIARNEEL